MRSKSIRVLVAGHSGLAKRTALQRVKAEIEKQKKEVNVAIIDAERNIPEMPMFLARDLEHKMGDWKRSVEKEFAAWRALDPVPDVTLLSIHLSYLWQSHLLSPAAWPLRDLERNDGSELPFFEFIRRIFSPDYVVVLIDDIQAVQHRIKLKGYDFRLREIMHWRDTEGLLAELLASHAIAKKASPLYPYEGVQTVAVRHSPNMLYRLLCEPERVRVYASFPIGAPRRVSNEKERNQIIGEIDRFRSRLREEFTLFDPLTIDEFPLQYKVSPPDGSVAKSPIELLAVDQWTIPRSATMCDENRQTIHLETAQVAEIGLKLGQDRKSEIARQTQIRDHRLIDQSDIVVVYRPTWLSKDGDWSHGTYDEAMYAERRGKPLIAIRDPDADPPLPAKTLGIELTPASTAAEVGHLSDVANQNAVLDDVVERVRKRCANVIRERNEPGQ